MYKVLRAFEPDKQYNVKDLLLLLPEMKYKGLEYNLRHYWAHHYLNRKKENIVTWDIDNKPDIHTSKYYIYSITQRGINKVEYLKKRAKTSCSYISSIIGKNKYIY